MTKENGKKKTDTKKKYADVRPEIRRKVETCLAFLKYMIMLRVVRRDRFKACSRAQFDYTAAEYDRQGSYEMVKEDYPEILKELNGESFSSLLDCGCGTGAMLALLHEDCPEKSYTGIDLSEGMLRIARKRELKDVSFVLGDCEVLPFHDGQFDVVLCMHSFHHYPHPRKFFRSAYRVLKQGGRLILVDNTGGFVWRLKQNMLVIPRNNWTYHEGDVLFYSTRQVSRFCRGAGFAVRSLQERPGHKLYCIAEKPDGRSPEGR